MAVFVHRMVFVVNGWFWFSYNKGEAVMLHLLHVCIVNDPVSIVVLSFANGTSE
jgi:hypothetical protein